MDDEPPPSLRPPEKLSFWDQVKATSADLGDRAKDAAAKAKVAADAKIKEVKESEQYAKAKEQSAAAWSQTKEASAKGWADTQAMAAKAKDQAKAALQGKSRDVTFGEPKLGMTLAREQGGEKG